MSYRVLLVDDEQLLARSLAYALERDGFLVEVATDGQAAVAAATTGNFDLVLLDLGLPLLSGTDACIAIREQSDVPIIMLTARDSKHDVVLGLELGADDYVTKPFSTTELVGRIHALLRRYEVAHHKSGS
ncbi:MAG TPA: response regulator [Candidatus Krumholzibacteria bacterium]